MLTVPSLLPRVQVALGKRLRRVSKHVYQTARWRNLEQPKVLFIVGCQRSGTTLMARLFDGDINCRVFDEFSELSCADKAAGIRLNPLPDVAAVIGRVRAPLVVAKPLVETQNVRALLDYFAGSRALFVYRRYVDVVQSDLVKYGERNGIDNIRPIAQGNAQNWRCAGASSAVRELMQRSFSEDMNPHDAAALFWLARNQLFFDLDLENHPAVALCRYEHLVQQPAVVLRRIYEFVDVPCPDLSHAAQVHSKSVSKGSGMNLSPAVGALCDQLQARLDAHYGRTAAGD